MDVSGVRLWAIEPVTRGAAAPMRVGDPIYLSIRTEDVTLEIAAREQTSARNHLTGQVETLTPTGALVRVRVHCGFTLTALVTRQAIEDLHLTPGHAVTATIKPSVVHVIPREDHWVDFDASWFSECRESLVTISLRRSHSPLDCHRQPS